MMPSHFVVWRKVEQYVIHGSTVGIEVARQTQDEIDDAACECSKYQQQP
jgi:hypothetical protein